MGEKLNLNVKPFGDCWYCSEEGKEFLSSRGIMDHMTVFKRADGHIHVHGPIKNEPIIIEMLRAICSETDIGLSFKDEKGNDMEAQKDQGSMNPEVKSSDSEDDTKCNKKKKKGPGGYYPGIGLY